MKVHLISPVTETVPISEKNVYILSTKEKRGYQIGNIYKPFGSIFSEVYNEFHDWIKSDESVPSYIWDVFGRVSPSEIQSFANEGLLSTTLIDKIKTNTQTLPFRVGIYEGEPALVYVGYEANLFLYDMLMMKQYGKKLRVCPNCQKLFIQKTKEVWCEVCGQDKRISNRATYERLKNDPLRLAKKNLEDKLNARIKTDKQIATYANIILSDAFIPADANILWYKKLNEVDKEFMKLRRKKTGHRDSSEYEFTKEEFAKMLTNANIKKLSDLEKWIKETWDKHPTE